MKRNHIETVLGAVVIVVAVIFFGFSYSAANVGSSGGYDITADFSGTGGLGLGDSVEISGVKVGTVSKIELNDNYQAHVTMDIDDNVKLPDDSSALISSESLLGGKYLEIQPGASDTFFAKDGKAHIEFTQAPQNLEQLLGKFIFSMDKKPGDAGAAPAAEESAAPAAAPEASAPAQHEEKPADAAAPAAPAETPAP